MSGGDVHVECLTNAILDEIVSVMGLAQSHLAQWFLRPIFSIPARKLARILVQVDRDTASYGLPRAAETMLAAFVEDYRVACPQSIPKDGPLLVVSNHPGAYDILLLIATLGRYDLKIISSELSIFRYLPSIAPYFIETNTNPYRRLRAFRTALRDLEDGKVVIVFARGNVELDPALSLEAMRSIDHWSRSIDLFLRTVPRASTVVAIVSGVFSQGLFQHRLFRIWKKPEQRQKVAEIIQVASQLFFSKKLPITPRVSYSPLLQFSKSGENVNPDWRMDILKQTARKQMTGAFG